MERTVSADPNMKIVHRSIEKDGEGSVKVRAEDPEDLWHAYHLIVPGDGLQATTFRYGRLVPAGFDGCGTYTALARSILLCVCVCLCVCVRHRYRKVQKESSTGSVDAERLKINITIQVETVDYDVQGGTEAPWESRSVAAVRYACTTTDPPESGVAGAMGQGCCVWPAKTFARTTLSRYRCQALVGCSC